METAFLKVKNDILVSLNYKAVLMVLPEMSAAFIIVQGSNFPLKQWTKSSAFNDGLMNSWS